jgi:hypothetical protein
MHAVFELCLATCGLASKASAKGQYPHSPIDDAGRCVHPLDLTLVFGGAVRWILSLRSIESGAALYPKAI